MTDSLTEDELLATLRQMVGKSSVRQVARRMKIAHTTLGELLNPQTTRRPYGPTLEKIAAYIRKYGGQLRPAGGKVAARESATRYGELPDRLAVAMGALEVIRDAADLALRRVRATAPNSASPAEGSKAASEVLAASRGEDPPHQVGGSRS